MTKMGCPYRGKYPLMQRDGWHWQVPEWRQGLPDAAAQEVTAWWCSISTTSGTSHMCSPAMWAAQAAFIWGCWHSWSQFSSTGFVWLWGYCTKWDLNGSCRAGLVHHGCFRKCPKTQWCHGNSPCYHLLRDSWEYLFFPETQSWKSTQDKRAAKTLG